MSLIALWAALTIVLIGAAEAGYRIRARWPGADKAHETQAVSLMLSSTMALMTLLTAFTFNIANSRFDLRSRLTGEEANAVSTTLRLQQQLAPGEQGRLLPLMHRYVSARRAAFADDPYVPSVLAAERLTADLQTQIWNVTLEGLNTPEGIRVSAPLSNATNNMFSLAEARRAAVEARLPTAQIRVLLIFAIGVSMMIGAVLASLGPRHPVLTSTMFALFALAFSLIRDIDTSATGRIRAPGGAMDRIAEQMAQSERQPAMPGPSPAPGPTR